MTRELKGFRVTVTYENGHAETFNHLFDRCPSEYDAMNSYIVALEYLTTKGTVTTERIWL